jgi:hypothetical protein
MMMATGGGAAFVTLFVPLCYKAEAWATAVCCAPFRVRGSSGDDIRNDLIFDLGDLVLDDQFLLFHPLDAQGIAACLDHGVDRNIIVFMFLPQPRYAQSEFGLILIWHAWFPVGAGSR